MNAYFDLPNLRSYAKSGGHQYFQSCTAMLRQNFNIHFCFDKKLLSKEKKQSIQSIMNLMKLLTRNRGDNDAIFWGEKFPPRPLNSGLYSKMSIEQLTSLYFLDDPAIQEMIQHGCLLFASEGNEIKVLSNLLIEGRDIPTNKYAVREMKNWQVIEDNASPCTDIIIIDPYLFAQSDLLFEYNAYKIIEILCQVNTFEVNVVIFTFKNTLFNMIERQLKMLIGEKLKLTFVVLPETGKWKEHDRTILINYKMFDSSPSFTYFGDNGENVCNGRWLNVNSHGDRKIRDLSLKYIQDLQMLIDERKSGLNSIIGDKKCNFLKF